MAQYGQRRGGFNLPANGYIMMKYILVVQHQDNTKNNYNCNRTDVIKYALK